MHITKFDEALKRLRRHFPSLMIYGRGTINPGEKHGSSPRGFPKRIQNITSEGETGHPHQNTKNGVHTVGSLHDTVENQLRGKVEGQAVGTEETQVQKADTPTEGLSSPHSVFFGWF